MSHCRFHPLLDAYYAGGLARNVQAEFTAHLSGCPGCSERLETLGETERLLRAARPEVPELDSETARLVFRQAVVDSGILRRRARGWWLTAGSATVAAALAVGWGGARGQGEPPALEEPARVSPLAAAETAARPEVVPAPLPSGLRRLAAVPNRLGGRTRGSASGRAPSQHRRVRVAAASLLPIPPPHEARNAEPEGWLQLTVEAAPAVNRFHLAVGGGASEGPGTARVASWRREPDGTIVLTEVTASACAPAPEEADEEIRNEDSHPMPEPAPKGGAAAPAPGAAGDPGSSGAGGGSVR